MTMKAIQVDMFAVGLGAAVLTQFALEDSVVTVLADGGMDKKYPARGVLDALSACFTDFQEGRPRRIDLIVGTHYDGDHLKGLLPIVKDETIDIGEVWLPPLKNDTQDILGPLEAEDFLAQQLFDDETHGVLFDYLWDKARQIEEVHALEVTCRELARPVADENRNQRSSPESENEDVSLMRTTELRRRLLDVPHDEAVEMFRLFFEKHEADAVQRTGSARLHESGTYDSRYPDALDLARELKSRFDFSDLYYYYWHRRLTTAEHCEKLFLERPERKRTAPFALAMIRKSLAAGAITATHLEKITEALRNRRRPIRPRCPFVSTGKPSRFVWSPSKNRFVRHEEGGESDLVLTLLGPADQLVEKHRHRLPVGSYFFSLMYRYEAIHLESITPSNQLSYIFTLEMKSQRILISGDAGCYGFRKTRKSYYPALLQALSSLQVIQVAHHAGHNYYFYNALLTSGFACQNAH